MVGRVNTYTLTHNIRKLDSPTRTTSFIHEGEHNVIVSFTVSFHLTSLLVDVLIHRPLHPTVTLVSSIGESGGVCGVNVECCTAPIGGLVHCEVRGGRYWLSSPIRPCQWLCGVICGAVYDCHTAGAIRREDVTHIAVIIICIAIVKDDGIVWY